MKNLIAAALLFAAGRASAQVVLPQCSAPSVCLAYHVNVLEFNPGGYIKWANGTTSSTTSSGNGGGPPSGAAGGDLSGTYPNPTVIRTQAGAVNFSTITAAINAEAATRAAADTALAASTTTLQANITAEAVVRAAADTAIGASTASLRTDLTNEATAVGSSTTTLQANITAETAARVAADNLIGASTATLQATKASTGTDNTITRLNALDTISHPVTMTSSMTNTSQGGYLGVSSVTANAFFGNGANLTNFVVSASSNSNDSKAVNSLTYVQVSTLTATLRGNRYTSIRAISQVTNGSAGAREYTIKLQQDGVDIGYPYLITVQNTINGNATQNISTSFTSTAGVHTYTINFLSSSATGTQTVTSREISVIEF